MNIRELADMLDAEIELIRYPNQSDRWLARFKNCEIKESKGSGILRGAYGDAKSPTQAICAYCVEIQGKWLVFNASNAGRRKEFSAPTKLTYGGKHG